MLVGCTAFRFGSGPIAACKFLARLYHDAPVLPVSAGCQADDIRRWLNAK